MGNPFCHVELGTTDAAKAKAFYAAMFDWTLQDMPMGNDFTYTLIKVGEGTGGGLFGPPMDNKPSAWMPYVLVDDIKASTEKARTLGASVVCEPTAVADMGWMAIFVDPTGATIGMWQSNR
jgi:predicted enzyme related to lactoylglutathione lyase